MRQSTVRLVFSLIMRAEPSHSAMPTEPGWKEYQLSPATLMQLRKQTGVPELNTYWYGKPWRFVPSLVRNTLSVQAQQPPQLKGGTWPGPVAVSLGGHRAAICARVIFTPRSQK